MTHKFQGVGGCAENPGVRDNGNGGLVYTSVCVRCGLERKRGSDYTGQRPGNNFGPVYYAPSGNRVGNNVSCNADQVAEL